MFVETSLHSIR